MPEPDKVLPENSKENLDRKLDHAIEETFPTSDPVSVSVTKGGAIDYDDQGPVQRAQAATDNLVGQARGSVERAAGAASQAAREAYEQGRRYASAARERYPSAERYYREGTSAVREQASEYPLLTLLVGIGIGYALGVMIHSGGSGSKRVPDYARTSGGYTPHYPQPRA